MSHLIVGAGYLGRRLAEQWAAEGRRVWATTRRADRADELRGGGVEPVVCDVLEAETLAGLPPAETVVWAAAPDRGVPGRRLSVEGLENVLAALPGRPRIVHVSSTGVYGQTDGGWVDEAAATEPAEEAGQTALDAERLLRLRQPDAIILRFAGIYGPGRLIRAADLLAGRPLAADPEGWLNLIHVEDGVRAIQAACAAGEPGQTYNVCDDRPARRREFYARLADLLGAPPPEFVPPAVGERNNRRVANARLRQELGVCLAFPSFEEGLVAAVRP